MKRKTIKEMLEIINKKDQYSCDGITGDEFESWLKYKKQDCIENKGRSPINKTVSKT